MSIRHRVVGSAALCCAVALAGSWPVPGQEPDPSGQKAVGALLPAEAWPTSFSFRIHRIGPVVLPRSVDADPVRPVALDAQDAAGTDVELAFWGPAAGRTGIWALVRSETSQDWYAYGPAHAGEQDRWIVPEVRFGDGFQQGRRFVLRVAMLEQAPPKPPVTIGDWQAEATALSAPQPVTVERRLVTPQTPARRRRIRIFTLDESPVNEGHPVLVRAAVQVKGGLSIPPADPDGVAVQLFVYVVVHPVSTQRWRTFGPAEVGDSDWQIREALIADAGEPSWLKYQMFAVLTEGPLPVGEVSYETWRSAAVAASGSIPLTVKPREVPPERPGPIIEITGLTTPDGSHTVERDDQGRLSPVRVDSMEHGMEVRGRVEHLPAGASIWLLLNPVGTPIWEAHGQALLTASEWRQPIVTFRRPGTLGEGQWRLMAVISRATPMPDLLDYSSWRRTTLAASETVIVVEKEALSVTDVDPLLSIRRIGGTDVGNPHTEVEIARQPSIEGDIQGLPPGASVWVGLRSLDAIGWQFSGPALVHEGLWHLPNARFTSEGKDSQVVFDVLAVVVRKGLPATPLSLEELQWYALASSPVVRVEDPSRAPPPPPMDLSIHWRSQPMVFWTLIGLLFLALFLLLLALLEWLLGVTSLLFRSLAEQFNALSNYLRGEFKEVPEPKILESTIGLIILGLCIFAISGYFPIYTHALETVLALSTEKSASLAVLFIVATGLAGVILHLSHEYGNPVTTARHAPTEGKDADKVNVAFSVMIVVTAFLWIVQTILYFKLYSQQLKGDSLIPAMMGAAAFGIAAVETLSFYWVTRLTVATLAWSVMHLAFAPFQISARTFSLTAMLYGSLPSRKRPTETRTGEAQNDQEDNL